MSTDTGLEAGPKSLGSTVDEFIGTNSEYLSLIHI